MTLYEMRGQARELYELLSDGVIDGQTFRDTLEGLGVNEKLESYCQIIGQLEADAEMLKAEAAVHKKEVDRCTDQAKSKLANAEDMRQRMAAFMESAGLEKTNAGTFSISVKPSTAVDIPDPSVIPKKFFVKQDPKLDRAAIREALKAGIKVRGASFSTKKIVTIK